MERNQLIYQIKLQKYQKKDAIFRLKKSVLEAMMIITIFLVFTPMITLLTLDNNKQTIEYLQEYHIKKTKRFDFNLEPTIYNFANGRVNLKFNNSILEQKCSSLWYSNV